MGGRVGRWDGRGVRAMGGVDLGERCVGGGGRAGRTGGRTEGVEARSLGFGGRGGGVAEWQGGVWAGASGFLFW